MPKLIIHDNGQIIAKRYETGLSLLQIIQAEDLIVSAPCGGNGTCGKCKVKVKNKGFVNSCTYIPTDNLEVFLPTKSEALVLTHQSIYTLNLPLLPSTLALNSDSPVGLAIDIGTTSIVLYWIDLSNGNMIKNIGISNPQVKYGADVISRINFCSNKNAVSILQQKIIEAINFQVEDFVENEKISNKSIVKVSVTANTTMLHLLAGINPTPIALAPFKASFTDTQHYKAKNLSINIHQDGDVYLLPSISAYVGSDIVAGIASLVPDENIKIYLFIDIGTNGEMALVTPDNIYCCATAAGPAFEGANIFCGMGAFDGAISAFDKNGYKTIGDTKPVGICGSGLIDIIAYSLENEIISSDGNLINDFVVASQNDSGTGKDIVITPQDIREVQLAKSAICTGINILIKKAGLTYDDIDAVFLAGGFGNFMDPINALKIGLMPFELKNNIIPVGNTSGSGAKLHVINNKFMDLMYEVIKKSQLIELSTHPEFELEFAMNMYFNSIQFNTT